MHTDIIQHAHAADGHLLTQGRYSTFLTTAGTGYAAWNGQALTRWSADPTEDSDGFFIYLRDEDSGAVWSLGTMPAPGASARYGYRFAPGLGELSCLHDGIDARLELCLAPDTELELRRITLHNTSATPRRIALTSYAELALNHWAADAAHPAFSKLFVQTEWNAPARALLARRRPRSPGEAPCWLVHALAGEINSDPPQYETDRARFLGRGYSRALPRALTTAETLTGTVGNVLDPIISLRRVLTLQPGASAQLCFLLGAAADRDTALDLATRYAAPAMVITAFQVATAQGDFSSSGQRLTEARAPIPPAPALPPPAGDDLQFWNGYGGFSADGREYRIRLQTDAQGRLGLPPQPWTHVVANPHFGFLASETGAGCTWSQNSRENRLTPWYNDPLLDPHGEALYLRDEDSGEFWSLTPGPAPRPGCFEIGYGFGYCRYRQHDPRLNQELWLFVPRTDPLKLAWVRLHNPSDRPRRLALFAYARLVLGVLPGEQASALRVERDPLSGALLAENHNREFAGRIAFAALAMPEHTPVHVSADRAEFIGLHGSPARPAALRPGHDLSGHLGSAPDPCLALQANLVLAAGATIEATFLLGETEGRDEARALVEHYRAKGAAAAALHAAQSFWQNWLDRVRIHTPAPDLDLMVNGWAAYQTLACRLWARSAFYQSGGAFGFRDQLQDAAALLYYDPQLTRQQLLLHAAHQFVEGDVLHWWHPPLSQGIRTRFSDDLLWLPYLAAFYAHATGDWSLFGEPVPFLRARALAEGEDEAFLQPEPADESASFYEHCCRALDRSLTQGAHGLPLMGSGDWNDGMNRVGREGRGESVWLGFFLYTILGAFVPICGQHGDPNRARRYAAFRRHLAKALNEQGWDGAWYRRAWYDNGAVLGSAASDECRIDALAQAWAVLSQAAPLARAEAALDAVEEHLIAEDDGLIRLLTPPFVDTPHDPGYIKGYVAGVRENGGQYTHAALWVVQALAMLGRRERAAPLLAMLGPVRHSLDPAAVARYQVEPYVIAADIYGVAPHVGRGGWTWYTGSAGWLLRVALESMLGLHRVDGTDLRLRPCIPDSWPGFSLRYRLPEGDASYAITVDNPESCTARVVAVMIDGQPGMIAAGAACIPLFHDGRLHRVTVTLGTGDAGTDSGVQDPVQA